MAKKKINIGSIVKGRVENGVAKPDYIKINGDHTFTDGQYINLESKNAQLARLAQSVAEGKLSENTAAEIRKKIENIPDFVRFQLTILKDV